MKSPVFQGLSLTAVMACLAFTGLSTAAVEKAKSAKPPAAGKSTPPATPARPKPETRPEPAETKNPPAGSLEPLCAALEPLALRTEMARPLGDGQKTVLVPAREDNVLGLTHLSREEFTATGLDWDQFMTRAAAAATRLLESLTPQATKNKDGTTAYITLRSDRPFAASVVLSPQLLPRFQEQFGDRLVVLMPDRNTVYLFSRNFGRFQDFGPRVLKEYAAALYPCSTEAFEVSRDGLKCLGAFDDGDGASDSSPAKPAADTKSGSSITPAPSPPAKKKSPRAK